jgi:hypothetical protein
MHINFYDFKENQIKYFNENKDAHLILENLENIDISYR